MTTQKIKEVYIEFPNKLEMEYSYPYCASWSGLHIGVVKSGQISAIKKNNKGYNIYVNLFFIFFFII